MLIGPAITWGSRHLKKQTIGNFNGHFCSNFSLVWVRNALQSSWNCLCSRCVICSFFLRPSTSLFVIIPMSTALLSLLLSSDVTSIFANCVKALAEVVTLSFKNLLIIDLNSFSRSDARNGTIGLFVWYVARKGWKSCAKDIQKWCFALSNLSSVTALATYWYPSCFFGAVFSSSACLQYSLILERSVSDFPATGWFSSHLLKSSKGDWNVSRYKFKVIKPCPI